MLSINLRWRRRQIHQSRTLLKLKVFFKKHATLIKKSPFDNTLIFIMSIVNSYQSWKAQSGPESWNGSTTKAALFCYKIWKTYNKNHDVSPTLLKRNITWTFIYVKLSTKEYRRTLINDESMNELDDIHMLGWSKPMIGNHPLIVNAFIIDYVYLIMFISFYSFFPSLFLKKNRLSSLRHILGQYSI